MKTIGVIPARWGSTRFPGKGLALLCGKPLVQWVWERSRLARRLDELVVATDDERIRQAAENFGARTIMTSATHPSGTDRVAEAVRGMDANLVVNIQGDEPLMDPELIDCLVDMADTADWDMITAAAPLATPPDDASSAGPTVCKVVFDASGRALYFSRHPIPFLRDAQFRHDGPVHWRHIGIYLYQRAFLERLVREPPSLLEQAECLEQLRALHIGGRIGIVQTDYVGMGVDIPADVPVVESALRRAGLAR
ncbi:MAG: 3-deoxy-manno-octulosonate cytidylyltransferase [Kiritimatiellia bacterium]